MGAADKVGVLALPAQACGLGQRLFHHRRGIDKDLHLAAETGDHELGKMLELAAQHVVIVAVAA